MCVCVCVCVCVSARVFALTSSVVERFQGSFRRSMNLCELEVCDASGLSGEPSRCPETGARPSRVGLLPRTCGNLWRRISSESQIYPSLGPCGAPKIVAGARALTTFCFFFPSPAAPRPGAVDLWMGSLGIRDRISGRVGLGTIPVGVRPRRGC